MIVLFGLKHTIRLISQAQRGFLLFLMVNQGLSTFWSAISGIAKLKTASVSLYSRQFYPELRRNRYLIVLNTQCMVKFGDI